MWRKGLDQEAKFHIDSALSLFKSARSIDPQFIPAHLSYMVLMRKAGRSIELRKNYEITSTRTPFGRCVNAASWTVSSHDSPKADALYDDLLKRDGRTACTEIVRLGLRQFGDIRVDLISEAIRQYGNAPVLTAALVVASRKTMGPAATRYFDDAIAHASNTALVLEYEFERTRELLAAGEHKSAEREGVRLARMFASDRRPHIQWRLLEIERELLIPGDPQFPRHWHELNNRMRSQARSGNAPAFEADALLVNAIDDVNRGDLRAAVNYLREATALALKLKSADLQMHSFLYRGRALAALGEQDAAIGDLRRAAAAARLLGERYRLAEAYHHMAHAYEARANWPKAIAAVDTFVIIGATVRDKSMRMIRLSDAATIQWKAGYHERANELYTKMVQTIDADSMNFEYAGAFYERTGDLARAADYYRAAETVSGSGNIKLALAGLTRVFERLGSVDSAIVTAKKHDALVLSPEREILLPRLLARIGRRSEAIQQSERWVGIQLVRGSPAGIASAYNQEAELRLQSSPATAIALVARSDSFARRVNSMVDRLAARRLRGLAKAQLGDLAGGTIDLIEALRLSKNVQDIFLPVTLMTDIATATARAGRGREALIWFARADVAASSATANFEDPVLIARFRNARSDIFDGAFRTILHLPKVEQPAKFLEWSGRKKGGAVRNRRNGFALPGPRSAVLDYLTIGDTIVVTVLTKVGARTVTLPLSTHAVIDMSRRLSAPLRETHNGNIDIQRAYYSLDLAQRMYDGLLLPVAAQLSGVEWVTIVPDVPLDGIPFDALVAQHATGSNDYFRPVYAADKWTISFAPTVAVAQTGQARRSFSGSSLLFVSHSAPAVDRERLAVRSTWGAHHIRELIGSDATESKVRHSAWAQLVHFATHAVSDDVDPFRSHLVLEAAGDDDGLMHSKEIRGRRWGGSLIFLSACETSSGPSFAGTGTLSLGRAFLNGGAGMVIATQWPIGETATDISRAFYDGLSRGQSPSEALHAGKRGIRMNPSTAHPFYWASHILINGYR